MARQGQGEGATDRVLAVLADGAVHSGEVLAAQAGVSRAAVWKAVERLRHAGHDIEAVPGRGYRAVAPYPPLDRAELVERLAMAPRELDLRVFREVDSTNAVLRRDPPREDRVGVAVAERQTAGRGRRGRGWCSPPGGIYLSVSWPYAHLACGPGGLTLTVGVFLAEVLRSLGIARAGVKWPNDIWVDGRKLAGVLTELDGDPMGACRVTVGVGLNWRVGGGWPEDFAGSAVGIADLAPGCERTQTAAAMLNAVTEACHTAPSAGERILGARWRAVDLLAGEAVIVRIGDRAVEGQALGIDDDGALLVDSPEGRQRFVSGDVSVRPR
ncbi:biotin--[acetyl-CoA-carboxylase] ligase [Arhodomonas sp. SL1]|uniref:biotin--[acetyl-CoA-carboxylase] ligase n=1 Tax=Arhodomonas sp. SL1 TaxID=3425691 RepID=UPI003F882A73